MKRFITIASLLLFSTLIFSQDITGLWKGTIYNDSTKTSLPYELLIKKEKGKFSGYSYTQFLIDGQEYYGVKKVKVSVAKDGKVIILDAALMKNNYPEPEHKKIKQLDVLDLVNHENEISLDGLFVTNLTKQFMEVTGHINIKRVSPFSESGLMQYLQKEGKESEIAVVK